MTRRDDEMGWWPRRGSWEESVLSWNEQIDQVFRRRQATGLAGLEPTAAGLRPTPRPSATRTEELAV